SADPGRADVRPGPAHLDRTGGPARQAARRRLRDRHRHARQRLRRRARRPERDPVLAHRNPVAKLAAALVPTLALLSTLDPLTPALFLAVELALVPLFGMSLPRLARRGWPLLVTAAGVASAQLLFTTGGLAAALGIALRI